MYQRIAFMKVSWSTFWHVNELFPTTEMLTDASYHTEGTKCINDRKFEVDALRMYTA